jgi:imidazolonepropionase
MGARSVDHAVYLEEDEIEALRASGTVAVLLPGTTFFLKHDRFAPARALIDAGVTVALGTDFNPGTSCTQNMSFILTLAVLKLGMTPEESICAATLNAAKALNLADRVGSIEPGKSCDFSIFSTYDYREIPYYYAMNLVETVVANGTVAMRDGRLLMRADPVGRTG